jgi:serine/threonine-protein kinase
VDNRLGREVAVKIIHRHLRENKEVATRFLAEARAAAKLKHPGIVEVYDVSAEDDRERYLVVELVRGNTLRKVLQEHREMPAEVGVAIAIELCEAIEHAHASGIIHRDIKPENVLVSLPMDRPKEGGPTSDDPAKSGPAERPSDPRSGRVSDGASSDDPAKSGPAVPSTARSPKSKRTRDVVIKITDFGIAKVLDAQGVTSTGQVLGSPAHMAPEQIEGGDVDGRTDVFALGVVLYECLVGHLPFEGKNPAQVLRRVLDGRYEPAERERPAVGGRYSAILDQALAGDLKERLASPAALAQALRDELESLGITEPHAEIAAYFEDPQAFSAELKRRLVPKLVARGEEHRRAGRTPAAACDFNRAHALVPDDLVILKRLTQLSRRDGTRALLRRGAIVAALSMTLGGVAYATVRALRNDGAVLTREERGALETAGPAPKKLGPEPFPRPTAERPVATDASSAEPHTSASARVAAVPRLGSGSASAGSAQSSDPRPVKFKVLPMGATLVVDGNTVDHLSGAPILLTPGQHTAKLTPQANDKASEGAKSLSFTVPPADSDDPKKAHPVGLSLSFKNARVLLLGPPGGQAGCGGGVTLTVGVATEIKMSGPVLDTSCQFILGGSNVGQGFQSIRAGEDNRIAWPK